MELQHNLSFPLFIKKSCIFEKHICSDWGISATHKRLLQSPCHVAYSKKGSLIAISIPVPPPADFRSCDGCSGLVNGVGLRTGKQGRRLWFASFIFDLILTLNPAGCPAAALPVQAEGEVQPYYLSHRTESERSQTAMITWMLLRREAARPCCCQSGFLSKGRHLAELE